MAPLSAALANGDDTLSITADCYSTAGTDAAITAALLAYYTSAQVDALLGDYRTGAAQDAETAGAITGALLAYYTAAQVDALLGDYRTASAQDTQTQAAITGALLAYRTGPDQDVFTTNQITSALAAYRSAADQDTATASSIAAALLSYYTITQVDGLLAGKLGVTEAALALQIAVRGGGRHRRADPGPHGRLAVKLDGPPQQRLQRGPGHAHRGSERGRLHPDPGGEPVEHPGESCSSPAATGLARPPTSWCTCPRQTTSTTHCTAASRETRAPGGRPRCTSPCRQTEWRSCTSVRTSRRRACPTRRQERWTFTASRSWTQPWRTRRLRRCC